MKIERHVWKTADGRLVPHEDPDAAFLEYPAGSEIGDDLARSLGLLKDEKQARPAANKARTKGADKASG